MKNWFKKVEFEDNETKADKMFSEYGQKQAKEFIGEFKGMFTEELNNKDEDSSDNLPA